MEKQGRGQMAKGKWTALVLVGFSLVSPWATHSSLLLAQQKTTVADTLLGPDGAPVTGLFVVTCPRTFASADGYTVLAQSKTSVTLAANGSFSVNLIPNAGASPGGSTYQVQYTANSRVVTEIWVVPISTSPVNLAAVRTASPPSPGVMLPFAQLNPPSGCAANQFPQWTGTNWTCVTSNTSFGSQSANQVLAAPNGAAGAPNFRALAAADLPASITSSTSGNAATATVLASSPNQCSGGQYATGIAASGNANCGVPSGTLGGLTTNQLPVASSASSLTNSSLSSVPALAATTLGTLTAAAGSGSLNASTTYYYTVVPLTASGLGPASAEGSVTTGGGGNTYKVTVPYSPVTGTAGYCLMGRTTGAEQMISCVHSGATLSMTDNGSITPGGVFPTNSSAIATASGSFVPVFEEGVVHASRLPGSDMCAQISNGWAYLIALGLSSGTVDARGITGTQNVAGSCFSNYPNNETFTGTLLTQSVEMVTSVSQVLPHGAIWDGGSSRAQAPPEIATNVGTNVVQATGFPASTPVIQFGVNQVIPQLGAHLRNMGVSCIPPGGSFSSTSIGVQNSYSQEGSGADYLIVYGCEVGVDIENGGGGSPAINGGPWNNVHVFTSADADSTAVCFRYGSATTTTATLFGVHTLHCAGNNNNSGQMTAAGIQIDGSYVNIDGVHIEQAGVGVEIAKNHSVYDATITNVHCLNISGVQGTSCVDIASGHSALVNLIGVDVNSSLTTNVIKDNLTNGCTLPQATAGSIQLYIRDNHNRITTSSQDCTASAAQTATALAATPTQCTGGQYATGVATSGNANCGTPSGGGNVSNSGTPTNGQVAQWTNSTTIQGISTLPASVLPNPTASTLGGIESITSASHKWVSYIDTSGVPHQSQPADTDLGATAAGAIPYVNSSVLAELSTTPYSAMVSGATNPAWATPTANGQCFMSGASSYATTIPSFQTCPTGGGGGNVINYGTPTANQIAQWTDSTHVQGISTLPASVLPNPTASTLGGIESIVSASHNWIAYIDTSGVPHQSQPASADLSDYGTFPGAAFGSQTQKYFFAAPNAANGNPSFRAIVASDIPTLNQSTSGNAATATALATTPSQCSGAQFATGIAPSGNANCATPPSGTVTSVAMTGDGTVFNSTVSGSPITASGTLAPALLNQSANTLLAGPASGSAVAPTFRALVAADLGGANNPYCDVTDPTCVTFNEEFFTASGSSSTTGATITFQNMWSWVFSCGTSGGQSFGMTGESAELGMAQMVDCSTAAAGDTVAAHVASSSTSSSLQFGNITNWRAMLRLTLDATTGQAVRAGFCGPSATANLNCPGATGSSIAVRYDAGGGDTGFYGEMCNSSACASTSSALCAVDTSAHTFLMRSVTAHTVLFSCDGGTEYSVSADYPTGGVVPTFWHQTLSGTQHTIKLSFFKLKVWGLSR
jgi:hypothetical protein